MTLELKKYFPILKIEKENHAGIYYGFLIT